MLQNRRAWRRRRPRPISPPTRIRNSQARGRARRGRAARRAPSQMMQAEKVSADIREAHESLAGEASATPLLAAAARRLEQRLSQAPALIEPCVKALDEALEALEAATSASRRRCARPISIRANSSASRSGCSRCAAWRANIRRRSTDCRRSPKNTPPTSPPLTPAGRGSLPLTGDVSQRSRRLCGRRRRFVDRAPGERARPGEGGQRRTRAAETGARAVYPSKSPAIPSSFRPTASTGSNSACRPIQARAPAR